MAKTVLWWGRSDVDYSRNRIIRHCFESLGWKIVDFWPILSQLGDFQAYLSSLPKVDLVWIPCFRQRDIKAAARWAKRKQLPLIFDPLISAYDKQVLERKKYSLNSVQAKRVLEKEKWQFQRADYLVADTEQHTGFFADTLAYPREKIHIIPVGAEEALFTPQYVEKSISHPLTVLFYGSFLALQGPEIIAEAITLYQGPTVKWHFIGRGPFLKDIQAILDGREDVVFTDWIEYTQLPAEIAKVDICLGIFGQTDKTLRVIPNKFYQTIACGRPIITCDSPAYPEQLRQEANSGIYWVPAGDAQALADKVAELAINPDQLINAGNVALISYQHYFSEEIIQDALAGVLEQALSSIR